MFRVVSLSRLSAPLHVLIWPSLRQVPPVRMPSRLPAICDCLSGALSITSSCQGVACHITHRVIGFLKTWCENEECSQKDNLTPSSSAMMRSHQIEGQSEAFLTFLIKTCVRLTAKRGLGSSSPSLNVEYWWSSEGGGGAKQDEYN